MARDQWGVTVSVIFTDIARSTALMFELGPDRYDGVRRRHLQDLREALADHGGREVKGLGDGLMAVVPSAAGAVAAAVAMQQRTAAQARALGIDLQIRVGVAVGDASVDEGDYFGPPVVEAARLCSVAGDGEIWTSAMVRALAGERAGATFTPLGTRALKGLPEATDVHRVEWSPVPVAGPGRAAVLSGTGQFTLAGRASERAAALAAWDDAVTGGRHLLLVAGEPGVGKSRLLAEVAAAVHAGGARVLIGRCDREGGGPFQPFVLALRQYLDDLAVAGRVPDFGTSGPVLARLLPELGESPDAAAPAAPIGDPAADRLVLFDAVADAVHRVAGGSPTLLVVEDLHWAAATTIQLLRHLVGWPREAPLLIACTYRATEMEAGSELGRFVAESVRLPGARRLELGGLDEPAIMALVTEAAGGRLADPAAGARLAALLRRQTNGNALYATQLLAHLVETGSLDGADTGGHGLPASVRDLVLERIDGAGPDVARLMELCAVAGERFSPLLLETVDDLGGGFLDAVDRAVGLHLLETVGGSMDLEFVHALVRTAVYERMSPLRRVRIHDGLAERLAAAGTDQAALLAHHAAAAAVIGPRERARALAAARRAGDVAMAAFEHHEAARWYEVALGFVDEPGEPGQVGRVRAATLAALGIAQRNAGVGAFRETLLEAGHLAAAIGHLDLQVSCALENTRGTFASTRRIDDERVALLEATLDAVGDGRPADRARLMASLGMELAVGPGIDRRRALIDEAVRLARASGDDRALAWVLMRAEAAIVHLTTVGERRRGMDELMGLVARQPDDPMWFQAWKYNVRTGLEQGDPDRIDASLDRVAAFAARLRQPQLALWEHRLRGTVAGMRGRFDEALAHTARARDLERDVDAPDAGTTAASQVFFVRYLQGRLQGFADAMARTKGPGWMASIWAGWSLLHAETGDLAEARESLTIQHDIDFWDYPNSHTATSGIAAAALAAARVGDTVLAERLLPVLDAAAGYCIADSCYFYGPVAHCQGVLLGALGDLGGAQARLREALDIEHRLGADGWSARTLAELARVLTARRGSDDAAGAAAVRASAAAVAARTGAAQIEELMETPLTT